MKTTTANTPLNRNSLTTAAWMNRGGWLHNFTTRLRFEPLAIGRATHRGPKAGKMKRFLIFFAMCFLAVIPEVGVANAAAVTVFEKTIDGTILSMHVATACEPEDTADTYSGYQFLFWDNQGTISWNQTVSICPGSTDTVATAWYLPTGSGPCPPTGCTYYVTTLAFSVDHNEFLASGTPPNIVFGTPIQLVEPNSPPTPAWTGSPSNTVNTEVAESISATSALAFPDPSSPTAPPFAAEPFRYWQQVFPPTKTPTPIGVVYHATQNTSAYVIAFYGPDPCMALRNELASCLAGPGLSEPLNCAPIGKLLQACEVANREQ